MSRFTRVAASRAIANDEVATLEEIHCLHIWLTCAEIVYHQAQAIKRIICGTMASKHYTNALACLRENLNLMSDASGNVRSESQPLWNLSNALIALADAMAEEFEQLQAKVTSLERKLQR